MLTRKGSFRRGWWAARSGWKRDAEADSTAQSAGLICRSCLASSLGQLELVTSWSVCPRR
jgi:hypothetical protein